MMARQVGRSALAQQAPRDAAAGRLKIFLGAAPGVGKTMTMLNAGLTRQAEGQAVLVGAIAAQRDEQVTRLLARLEAASPWLAAEAAPERIDVDAIRAWQPDLVLVDELQQTNPPGERHRLRYQDVREILASGIDVYTTLNIAHLDSLKDVVAQTTGLAVADSVPDELLDAADEVELVDFTIDDLIRRQQRADQAEGAAPAGPILRPEMLVRLRELSLRRTRRQIEEHHPASTAAPTDIETGGGLLVVLRADAGAIGVVRLGRRIAAQTDAPWFVASFQPPADGGAGIGAAGRPTETADAMQLARRLGAETTILPGAEPVAEILDFAHRNEVSELLVARTPGRHLDRLLRRDFIRDLLDESGELEVRVIAADAVGGPGRMPFFRLGASDGRWLDAYLASTVAVFLAGGIAKILDSFIYVSNLTLIFLAAVLYSATAFGLAPAIYASMLGVVVYNYFFVPPLMSLSLTNVEDVLTTGVFVAVAILISNLAGRLHDQALAARQRERRTDALFRLSRKMAAAAKSDDVLRAIAEQVDEILSVKSVVLLPTGTPPVPEPVYPQGAPMSDADQEAALWAFQYQDRAGRGSGTLAAATRLYQPLRTSQRAVGVLGLEAEKAEALRDPEFLRLLDALAGLAAVAIERIRLAEEIGRTQVLAESEGLRAALLSSISHDLRTPLSSIIGSSSSLISYGHQFNEETRRDLLQTIYEEADRLNQFVGNLLEMTKLESGALTLNRQWIHIDDLIGTTLDSMRQRLSGFEIATDIEPRLPMLLVDFVLMERVLSNLLENAAKYSHAGGIISIRARLEDDAVGIQVVDEGIGLSARDLGRIFDKFFRARERDRRIAGTGLGLSICKGIVEAHHGELIAASAGEGKGSCFSLRLPVAADQPVIPFDEADVA